jgi:hypothetical protein
VEGDTVEIAGAEPETVKATKFEAIPPWRTCALPLEDPVVTVATICVSLQLMMAPRFVPSRTFPVPCDAPNPLPEKVTWVPGAPFTGDTPVILGAATMKFREFEVCPPCDTWTKPDVVLGGTTATICVSLHVKTKGCKPPILSEPVP